MGGRQLKQGEQAFLLLFTVLPSLSAFFQFCHYVQIGHSDMYLSKTSTVHNIVPKLSLIPVVRELLSVVKTTMAKKCAFLTFVLVKSHKLENCHCSSCSVNTNTLKKDVFPAARQVEDSFYFNLHPLE